MYRRTFLKIAMISSAGIGSLLKSNFSLAKGISSKAFEGVTGERCYVAPAKGPIPTSLTDLFKVGPGPSSSHTIAPLRISSDFLKALENLPKDVMDKAQSIEVRLFGSLSATGKGHRTDRAILAGLLGQKPETCDTRLMDELQDTTKRYTTTIGGKTFVLGRDIIVWDKVEHNYPYSNTMIMRLIGKNGETLFEREYYSTGGGFYQWKGQPPPNRGKPVYPYGSMIEFKMLVQEHKKSLHEIMMENEKAIMKVGDKEVIAHLDFILKTMENSVKQGISEEGLLPAPFEFHRKAKRVYERSKKARATDRLMQQISSYALAGSEGNAAGRLAVTAPTLGSAGTMPALVYMMKHHLKLSQDAMRKGLLAAGLVGFLCKHNASVAGADVGCQGEIGVASSMASAMISYATGASIDVTEVAATIALEHHLGMSCDPVGGFVLIPCIERNAFGAIKAYNAYLLAKNEITSQRWEDLDRVIIAMYETGMAMSPRFKETGTGGLAVTMVDC
ncbi:MAG: L-serine ammonia-lyase [Syntrophorhabdaceae bacterium]|nr:L-serine ammonia-lyase [Syntrophorhabdaceae bacterium]